MFLALLSASLLVLGLIATATGFSDAFLVVAALILALDLFVGLATLGRIAGASNEDLRYLQGMNRLRHAYHEMVPGLEPYFITSQVRRLRFRRRRSTGPATFCPPRDDPWLHHDARHDRVICCAVSRPCSSPIVVAARHARPDARRHRPPIVAFVAHVRRRRSRVAYRAATAFGRTMDAKWPAPGVGQAGRRRGLTLSRARVRSDTARLRGIRHGAMLDRPAHDGFERLPVDRDLGDRDLTAHRQGAGRDGIVEAEDAAIVRFAVDGHGHGVRRQLEAGHRGADPDEGRHARCRSGAEVPAGRRRGRATTDGPRHVGHEALATGAVDLDPEAVRQAGPSVGIAIPGFVGVVVEIRARAGDGVPDLAHRRIIGGWTPVRLDRRSPGQPASISLPYSRDSAGS